MVQPLPTRMRPGATDSATTGREELQADLPSLRDEDAVRAGKRLDGVDFRSGPGAWRKPFIQRINASITILANAFAGGEARLTVEGACNFYLHFHAAHEDEAVGNEWLRPDRDAYLRRLAGFTRWLLRSQGALLAMRTADLVRARLGRQVDHYPAWSDPIAVALRLALPQAPEADYDAALAWCLAEHAAAPDPGRAAWLAFIFADDRPAEHALQPGPLLRDAALHYAERDRTSLSLPVMRGWELPLLLEAPAALLGPWQDRGANFPRWASYLAPSQAIATATATARAMHQSALPALGILLTLAAGEEGAPVATALLATQEPGALAMLLPRLGEKNIREAIDRAVDAYPAMMFRQCLSLVAGGCPETAIRSRLLKAISQNGPEVVRGWIAGLDAQAIDHLERLLDAADSDMAPRDTWPEVLRAPPWRQKGRKPVESIILNIAPISTPFICVLNTAVRLEANYGSPFLPKLVGALRWRPVQWTWNVIRFVDAAEIAPEAALALLRLKRVRSQAVEWLRRYPRTAMTRLLPDAVGPHGEARDAAGHALRWLRQEGSEHAATMDAVIAAYAAIDPRVVAAAAQVLDRDPLQLAPLRAPKLPGWFPQAALSRPVLRAGGRLPDEALILLVEMMAFSPPGLPYAGLAMVRAACTPESLGAYVRELLAAWLAAGAPPRDGWAMRAIAWLGDDECAYRLAQLIRQWPGASGYGRAVTGLDVLAEMASDAALLALQGLGEKGRSLPLRELARQKIAEAAEARGLTSEELADRLVPDLGLDARGGLDLDFGSRQFRVGFDEFLKPWVRDPSGMRLKELPKPNRSDDTDLAAAAATRWLAMKRSARAAASQQIPRLEAMLMTSRRLRPDAFHTFFATHRLMRNLAQRLVWGVYADAEPLRQPRLTFRVTDDLSLANAAEETVAIDLSEDAPELIGLLHPLQASPGELEAWGAVLGAYEIAPSFPQLSRETFALSETEKKAAALDRFQGQEVPMARLHGLTARGWTLGPAEQGIIPWLDRKLTCSDGRAGIARLELAAEPDPGRFRALGLLRLKPDWDAARTGGLRFGDLDAVLASEVLRAATLLDGTTRP
ncbi:MAG TPA: DUF4132 domain-containing protein [Roseomonas sp.]|jgi:hypothetical protein